MARSFAPDAATEIGCDQRGRRDDRGMDRLVGAVDGSGRLERPRREETAAEISHPVSIPSCTGWGPAVGALWRAVRTAHAVGYASRHLVGDGRHGDRRIRIYVV